MKISLAQMDTKLGDVEYNYKHAEELIRKAAKENCDVVCLPEVWNIGFIPKNYKEISDKDGSDIRRIFGALAKELNINIIAGSIANLKNDKVYNTSLIFDRKGKCIAEYDKSHLFTFAKEEEYFEWGDKTVTFELDGVLCGIIICYDVRFPELVRTLALKGIRVLFIPAAWPDVRVNHWNVLNQARAIENQIFIACVNSTAKADNIQYGGNAAIIDPWGVVLAKGGEKEEIITAEADLSVIENIRNTINVFRDRKVDLYDLMYK